MVEQENSPERTLTELAALASFPPSSAIDPGELASRATEPGQFLIVIDDDPTGSQSVAGIPVLTAWSKADLEWAFAQNQPVIFILTNSRSVAEATAAALNEDVVTNTIAVARTNGYHLTFLSRSDSILRGHFPAETNAIARAASRAGAPLFDGVVLVPAFPSAGRVTIGGIHYLRSGKDLIPVAQTQFAHDASFGYEHSDLRHYVEEKSLGAIRSSDVLVVTLDTVRAGADAIADLLDEVRDGRVVVADCVTDDDLRALCLGLTTAQRRGKNFLYRTGPSFVGAWIGQPTPTPIDVADVFANATSRLPGGLVIVGSHVNLTNRQIAALRASRPDMLDIELDVGKLNLHDHGDASGNYLAVIIDNIVERLEVGDVVVRTSRIVITGESPDASLLIATAVSTAISSLVHAVVSRVRPRFVVAKGGITSNDVASHGLEIRRGTVVGPLLPGLVSLWRPAEGLAADIPYIVFPGNVGDDDALLTVVNKLSIPAASRLS